MKQASRRSVGRWAAALAAGFAFVTAAAAAPATPDLDATIRYETHQVLANGVSRSESWQERLVRRGSQVWTERVLPVGAGHAAEGAQAGHKHFDFETAARHAWADAKGEVQLRYVDRDHRQVVTVPRAEWAAVGFDGRLDAAAHLLPPAVVAQMKRAGAGPAGAEWRTEQAKGWTHRVLWSPALQVALRIESRRDDGSVSRIVSLTPGPQKAGSSAPWQQLDGYEQLEYDDFMD